MVALLGGVEVTYGFIFESLLRWFLGGIVDGVCGLMWFGKCNSLDAEDVM